MEAKELPSCQALQVDSVALHVGTLREVTLKSGTPAHAFAALALLATDLPANLIVRR